MGKPFIVKSLGIAAVVLSIVAVSCWLTRKPSFRPSELRDTAGIEVDVTDTQTVQQGYRVICSVSNHADKTALSIVLSVQVVDLSGQILAENPLANLINLSRGEQKTISVPVPCPASPTPAAPSIRARASVSLVRWTQ